MLKPEMVPAASVDKYVSVTKACKTLEFNRNEIYRRKLKGALKEWPDVLVSAAGGVRLTPRLLYSFILKYFYTRNNQPDQPSQSAPNAGHVAEQSQAQTTASSTALSESGVVSAARHQSRSKSQKSSSKKTRRIDSGENWIQPDLFGGQDDVNC